MTDTISVRSSRADDAPTLQAIALSIVTAYNLPHDPELLRYGKRRPELVVELVAVVAGTPAGTVTLSQHPRDRNAGWVSKFFVDPLHRGSGVGERSLVGHGDSQHGCGAFGVVADVGRALRDVGRRPRA